jgi:BON domain-containing protein
MRLKLAAPLAIALAGAFAIPALAETNEVYTPIQPTPRVYYPAPTYYVPADSYYVQRDVYVAPETTTVYSYTPATTSYYVEPAPVYYAAPYTVYGSRGDIDAAITSDVRDNIASDPYISGHIDVSTRRNDVTLQGLVSTPGQVDRAGYRAREVDGVGDIDNQVRARVGSQ